MKTHEHIGSVAWLNSRLTMDILTGLRTGVVDDIVSAVLLAAISNANTSYLDARPDISQRHIAVGSVTDDMRRPVHVSGRGGSIAPRRSIFLKSGRASDTGEGLRRKEFHEL